MVESGALESYFGELHKLPLLNQKQELALAREIEALEVDHWRALLSYPPALDRVAEELSRELPESAPRVVPLLSRASSASRARSAAQRRRDRGNKTAARRLDHTARALREIDATRAGQRAADARVRAEFGAQPAARAYLARVARARAAEQRAKGRFVAANLRLVIALTRPYHRTLLPLEDLIQEGNLGLMRAVDSFDHRRGYRFSTYAAWWIRHSLNRAVSDKARVVRIPVHALDDLSKIGRASDRLAVRGVSPDVDALASESGLTPTKVAQLQADGVLRQPYSLDQELGADRDQNLHEILAAETSGDPEETLDFGRLRQHLHGLLGKLKPMEAAILRYRFGLDGSDPLTLSEVGQRYNLSRERIRQLQEQALANLRATIASELGENIAA